MAAKYANEAYDTFLADSADSIAARLSRNDQGIVVADLLVAAQAILRHNGIDKFYYQIVDSKGNRLAGDSRDASGSNEVAPRTRVAIVLSEVIAVS